jgi:hypothetical protein
MSAVEQSALDREEHYDMDGVTYWQGHVLVGTWQKLSVTRSSLSES